MLAFTVNQWIVVGLVLVLGWLLGLLSHSGSRKWKLAFAEERERRIAIERDRDARLSAAQARIAELEHGAGPIGAGTAASIAAAANGTRDDLSLIRGIDGPLETRLNEQGLYRFRDIAALAGSDAAALEIRLGLEAGRIAREDWAGQADALARGGTAEYQRRYA
jgi:predicted flap endonuclease-1-like 5' DNA nuclease